MNMVQDSVIIRPIPFIGNISGVEGKELSGDGESPPVFLPPMQSPDLETSLPDIP